MKNSLWLFFAKNSFFFISAKVFYFGIIVAHLLSPSAQCENYENLLSQFFHKNFVKAPFSVNKLLKSSYQGTFLSTSEFHVFTHCVQHKKYECKYFCGFFGNIGRDFFSWWGKTIFLFEALVCKKKNRQKNAFYKLQ